MAYQAAAIIRLVNEKVTPLNGDEDPLDTAVESSTWSFALQGAIAIAEGIAEEVNRVDVPSEETQS
jgi:hypothetical protein